MKRILAATRPARYWIDRKTYGRSGGWSDLSGLKNVYAGQPLLVIGNGPSLNNTPLDDFSGIPSIGMNKIDLLFDRVSWRPTLIVCMNNLVAKQHAAQFVNSDIPVFLSWKCRWFIERQHRRRVNYFLSRPSPDFSTSLPEGVGVAGTVTYAALQFAYYMGADPVVLFGVDHSFSFEGQPAELAKRKGADQNHFHPEYFKEGQWWGLPNLELSELGYRYAREAFERDGRRVVDATIDGKLDIFEKVSIAEAKSVCRVETPDAA